MSIEQQYLEHASLLKATGLIMDPWIDGTPRFRQAPLSLRRSQWQALKNASEAVCLAYEAVVRRVLAEPALLDRLGLTPHQRLMWAASAPMWHGVARADAFLTDDGIAICELNSDTPTGESEAVASGALARQKHGLEDPNEHLGDRFAAMVEAMHAALPQRSSLRSAAIVYPTELTEDLGFVTLIDRWLEQAGWKVTLGSPFNLREGGPTGLQMWGTPCDLVVRHYKTDWWGEREAVWKDESQYHDPAPLEEALSLVLRAQLEGRVAVVNPFGSVVTQNKRAMALMWEELDALPQEARDAVQRHVPRTVRMEAIEPEVLVRDRAEWVLKSDYGCEGDQVILGPLCDEQEWQEVVRDVVPEHWVAQRYFRARAGDDGQVMNHGVYLVGGEACGILCREQAGPTDPCATVVPVLIDHEEGGT